MNVILCYLRPSAVATASPIIIYYSSDVIDAHEWNHRCAVYAAPELIFR